MPLLAYFFTIRDEYRHTRCSDSFHIFRDSSDIGLIRRSDGCWVDGCVLWSWSGGRILLVLNVKIRRSYCREVSRLGNGVVDRSSLLECWSMKEDKRWLSKILGLVGHLKHLFRSIWVDNDLVYHQLQSKRGASCPFICSLLCSRVHKG